MKAEKEKLQQDIKNSFEMELDASYTLNFLIYIQNIYLNQNEEEFKFPYLSKKLLFNENFEKEYKELWNEVVQKLSSGDVSADIKYFNDERELFYSKLLKKDLENLMIFHEVYAAFQTWWDSFVGKFTLERSVEEAGQRLYADLTEWLAKKEKTPQKRLCIHLIYDECELTEPPNIPYFVIIPIQEFSIRCDELVPRIQKILV